MLVLSHAAAAAASAASASATIKCSCTSPLKFANPKPPLYSNGGAKPPKFIPKRRQHRFPTLAKADGSVDGCPAYADAKQPTSSSNNNNSRAPPPPPPQPSFGNTDTVFVGQPDVPLEGVIQFEKPSSGSSLEKWGRVALLAGGDVLALLLFSAIGRFSHGFSVFDVETLRTADPFVAGWFLGAYFLGGYGEDGRGMNGRSNAIVAAAKSWAVGIPLGIVIRTTTSGHIPPSTFILVTMGSTAVLLIGWRALSCSIFPSGDSKKDDVYRRGSPFELFELLTSLVRRW